MQQPYRTAWNSRRTCLRATPRLHGFSELVSDDRRIHISRWQMTTTLPHGTYQTNALSDDLLPIAEALELILY